MAEAPIKRTNFFDGQFLKQGEFLDMEGYHRHMRRRLLYMLFDKSGVVPYGGTDLAIEVENLAGKRIRVKAGTAVGRRDDLLEAKEIVLQADQIIDLNTVTPPLGTASTGIVTIHYAEQQTEQSSEGGTLGYTRVMEQAILTVHRRPATGPDVLPSGPIAPNGEPYVRLGNVAFDSVGITTPRDLAYLKTTLMAPAATIGISPNVVTAGGPVTLLLSSSGGLDLSSLLPGNITPMAGITVVDVPAGSRTMNSAIVNLSVATTATAGSRNFIVTIGTGSSAVTAQTPLNVQAGLQVGGFTLVASGDTMFQINGSGFVAGLTLEWTSTAGAGAFVSHPAILAGNITPTSIRVPLADIPSTATQGPVRVSSGGQIVTSATSIIPPARFDTVLGDWEAGPPDPTSYSVKRGRHVQITGRRFFSGLTVTIGTYTTTGFPNTGLGEARADDVILVRVPTSVSIATHQLSVQTGGGVVRAPTDLTVTLP